MQAIKEVFAEPAGFHIGDQVAVGGGDDAHVDLDGLASADRLDLALLQRAQQFDLRRERQLADFVEEQRAAVGLDEFAGMRSVAPVKEPFSWPNRIDSTRFPAWRRS